MCTKGGAVSIRSSTYGRRLKHSGIFSRRFWRCGEMCLSICRLIIYERLIWRRVCFLQDFSYCCCCVCEYSCLMDGCNFKKEETPLFKDAAIQDSLLCFLERIDSIPNSYGAPSLFAVSFWLDGQDSLIRFSANAAVWEYSTFEIDTTSIELDDSLFDPLRDNSPYNTLPPPIPVDSVITRYPNWIGLYRYGNKHVLVESDWDPSLVINMSALEPWEAFEHMYHYEDPMKSPDCDLTHYLYHCYRTYRYQSPNNVRLISRRIGEADPDFKTYRETIEY